MNTQDYEVPDYLRKPKTKQSERLWLIVAYATIPTTAVIFISSLIQMAYV